jgi:hypothetical protein
MPWNLDDVDKFKKGLSAEGKKKWVATANSVLSECMKKGGMDKECAAKAVCIANGTNDNEAYSVYSRRQEKGYVIEEKMHQGKNHIVVPVVMMVEGVHYGSHGPLFHSINELGKFPDSWNGIPVVINHPEIEGRNVSANSPDIIEQQTVGRAYNTYVKDHRKLAAEAWLDMERLQNLSKEVLDHIQKGEPIEVSLGLFSDDETAEGDWNGEHYEAIAKNHRPDHLALLPCSVGACSLVDGCGLGVNSDTAMDNTVTEMLETVTTTSVDETSPEFIRIESNINNLKKEDEEMAEKAKCTPCVKEKVDSLIANSQGKYTEDDREMLETLSETLLDRISEPVETVVEKIVEKTVEVNVLSDEDKVALAAYKSLMKEKRDKLIQSIQDNAKDVWTVEVLETMDDDKLERVLKSIKKDVVTDYSLNGGVVKPASSGIEPLYPVGVPINKK